MAYENENPLIQGASNDTSSGTPDVLSASPLTASLSSSTDVDYFKVTATSAGLIKLTLKSDIASSNQWSLALLNNSGDYVTQLNRSVSGTPVVSGSDNTGTSLKVSGLTASVATGSRFTLATDAADTTIYTVTGYNAVTGVLSLDKSLPSTAPTAGTALVFDPGQATASGGTTTFTAVVTEAGTYYAKVNSASWSSADNYTLQAAVLPTLESTGDNNTAADAADPLSNNRLLENAWMTGALSASTDVDVWVFSTATMTGDLVVDFAAPTGDKSKSQWTIKVESWDALTDALSPLLNASRSNISNASDSAATTGTSASFTIDDSAYATATTFVVTVSKAASAYSTDTYKLRVSGSTADFNDTPVIAVDAVSASAPGLLVDSKVTTSVKSGANSSVLLSSLFSVSDADAGQTISTYKVALAKADGETASLNSKIKVGTTDYSLGTGVTLTAAQMATAKLYPGTVLGTAKLSVQAIDNSGAADGSGTSSFVSQNLRIVSEEVGVSVATPSSVSLTEGANTGVTLSLKLLSQPSHSVNVYLDQVDNRFNFDKDVLTFTTANWDTLQTVVVKALDNQVAEPSTHTAQVSFTVTSEDSAYDGNLVTPVTVSIEDPANTAPTGELGFSSSSATQATALSATSTVDDANGLGTLNYQWLRWTDVDNDGDKDDAEVSLISGANSASYTPVQADVGKTLGVRASFVDGLGKTESVAAVWLAGATTNVNDAPTSTGQNLQVYRSATYTFKVADFQFVDADTNDALSAIKIQELPAYGTLSYNGTPVSLSSGAFTVAAADIGKLTYAAASSTSQSSDSFKYVVLDDSSASSAATTETLTLLSGASLTGTVSHWKGSAPKAMSNVVMQGGGQTATSTAGAFALNGVAETGGADGFDNGILTLAPTKEVSATAKATDLGITLTDVLAALKIYLGKSLPSDYSHPANFTAADFNGSGTVDLSDVLQLLKFYLGKTVSTGYGPAWVFIDKDDFTSSSGTVSSIASKDLITGTNQLHNLSKDHTRPADITHNVTDTTLELVGVLRGDVDGSWGSLSGVS